MTYGPGNDEKNGVAVFHLHLHRPGLWRLHGSRQPFVAPFARQRDAMAEAHRLAAASVPLLELGPARRLVVHLHNEWDGVRIPRRRQDQRV